MAYKSKYGSSRYGSRYGSSKYGSGSGASTRKTFDIDEIEKLKEIAAEKGVEVKEDKPSFFRRTLDFISKPLYASAGAAKAIVKNLDQDQTNNENILEEAWKGLSGQDKETYSDVLGELGVENKYVKGGLGFVLDVALDPTTYFGGALIRGTGKVIKGALKPVGNVAAKAAPQTAGYIRAAGTNLKDALGSTFVFGYKTSKTLDKAGNVVGGVADDIMRMVNRLGMTKQEIIERNLGALKGKFTKEEILEAGRLQIKNRRLELAQRKGEDVTFLTSKDKKINELSGLFKNKAEELADMAGISVDDAYKYYIPFIRKETTTGGLAPGGKVLKEASEGWKKEFKDLIPDDELLNKPWEAYSRREWDIVRNGMVKDEMNNIVETYGKDFIDDAAAKAEGFVPIYRKDKLQFFPIETRAGGTAAAVKAAKPLGYLKAEDAKFIDDFMYPEAKVLNTLAKSFGYDKLTRWFKTAVTAYFPAFHVRNMISGNIQNYSVLGAEALNPKNHVNGLGFLFNSKKTIKFKNWEGTGEDMNKILKENFQGASRYKSDLSNYIEETLDGGFKVKSTINKLNPRQMGNFVEMWQKSTAVSAGLRKGNTLERSLKLAETAGFDYNKLTTFESEIMKRAIPFYAFARKNAELQLKTLAKNPERILNQKKFADALSTSFGENYTEEDLKGLPDWAINGLGFKVKGNQYITQLGLPLEEFMERVERPAGTTLSSLNPIIKYPLESKLGFDFFREQKLTDIKKVAPATGKILMDAQENGTLPKWLENTINISSYEGFDGETKYNMSPKTLHFLRNLPTARFQNTLEKLFEKDANKVGKWMAFFSGMKLYDIDVEQQEFFRERDLRRDIEDQLLNKGIGQQYENFYIYK